MKGAVEGVLEHCEISAPHRDEILKETARLSRLGQRLLGLAARECVFTGDRERDESGLLFRALLVFEDPVRTSVGASIRACVDAGIELKMVTGDHPATAEGVAERLGIRVSPASVYTGEQLAAMKEPDRRSAFLAGTVFARVQPEQKYELVSALQASGKIVAMTGDGINDAPALRLADIGISMGEGATDVARESARMILLKNDFNGLVESVFEGRRVFRNLERSFSYLIAFHVPVFLLTLLPPALGYPSLLVPVHIVFLELMVHPVSAFAFEGLALPDAGRRVAGGIGTRRIGESILSGLLLSAFALGAFIHDQGSGTGHARALGFSVVLSGNLFLVWMESARVLQRRTLITLTCLFGLSMAAGLNAKVAGWLRLDTLEIASLAGAFGAALLAVLPSWVSRSRFH
jgi:Ca2+-transporting ATPase